MIEIVIVIMWATCILCGGVLVLFTLNETLKRTVSWQKGVFLIFAIVVIFFSVGYKVQTWAIEKTAAHVSVDAAKR